MVLLRTVFTLSENNPNALYEMMDSELISMQE